LVNDHASLYLRQTRTALSLEVPHQDTSEDFPPVSAADLDAMAQELTSQREGLIKSWYNFKNAPSTSKETLGLSELSLAEGSMVKKHPVFDISYNYVTEFDLASLQARAEGQQAPIEEVQMEEAKPVETPAAKVAQIEGQAEADTPKKRGIWGLWRS
jgi:hypothetical protein